LALKHVQIDLTDHHAAEIEAAVASGDFASASEVVRAALRAFFAGEPVPAVAEMAAEIDAMDAEIARGEPLLSVEDARAELAHSRRE
jgi:putative addiction module CopG family antidote